MLAEAEAADARFNAPRTVEQEVAAMAAVEDSAAECGQSAKAHARVERVGGVDCAHFPPLSRSARRALRL